MASSSRFSYPTHAGSGSAPRQSAPPISPAQNMAAASSSSSSPSNTYPLSPSPRASLPGRSRLSTPVSGVTSYLQRTPSNAAASSYSTSSAQQDLLDRPRDKTKNTQVAASSLSFLYAEIVSYTQGRVTGIGDLERRLSLLGYHHGQRLLPLLHARLESPSGGGASSSNKNPKRETRLLPMLLWVHGQAWKALFGKAADSLERSTERSDEYMISTNTPLYSKGISVPKDMSQLSVEAYTAGIVEAILDGMGFPARVTAHSVPTAEHPQRTTILIKLDKTVMQREEALG